MENISLQDEEFLKWLQTTEYNGSIGLTVKFYVKKEQIPEFHMVNNQNAQCSKIRKKVQFQKYKNTFFAISKMAKNQFFAPEKSLKLPKIQFSDYFFLVQKLIFCNLCVFVLFKLHLFSNFRAL